MSAILMDGKALSAKVRGKILEETHRLETGVRPGLRLFWSEKTWPARSMCAIRKACVGAVFTARSTCCPPRPQDELLGLVDELNQNERIHGILCQLPLPKQISE
ncbi:MAG: tetrahydrofolate dehydrogenase/cyclohydrolase catalytic domain-containing protein [Butyricicoccus pullicaecorum]